MLSYPRRAGLALVWVLFLILAVFGLAISAGYLFGKNLNPPPLTPANLAPSGKTIPPEESVTPSIPAVGTPRDLKSGLLLTGEVVFNQIEGGFWGIVGDDGQRYDIVNMPPELQKEGLRVRFEFQKTEEAIGFHQWGQIGKIGRYTIIE